MIIRGVELHRVDAVGFRSASLTCLWMLLACIALGHFTTWSATPPQILSYMAFAFTANFLHKAGLDLTEVNNFFDLRRWKVFLSIFFAAGFSGLLVGIILAYLF